MATRRAIRGFSLVELLLVLSILGIIGAIAIPRFLGAREYARQVGDARTNAAVLRMALGTSKADTGLYPAAGTYTWTPDGPPPAISGVIFTIRNASKMEFTLTVNANRLSYSIRGTDPKGKQLINIDQNGANI